MKTTQQDDTIFPYPRNRLLMVDGGQLGLRKHTIHGLVEFDITDARATLRQHKIRTGEALSFSAFFLNCLGKAIENNPEMNAYRSRRKMVLFADVDVNMLFEVEVDSQKSIRPHILRAVNRKSIRELHEEIRAFQSGHARSEEARFIDWFVRLPGWVRRAFLRSLFRNPRRLKQFYGTVLVSSVGMFGNGAGWGIPVPNHSLQLTLGGIGDRPGVVDGQVAVRKMMSVTVSFDHDLIDGAPAARFIRDLKRMVERGVLK